MDVFIGLWIAQIAFGIIVAATNPKRDDVSNKAQTARKCAIYAGLVPCVGIMLICQIFYLIMYRVLASHEDRAQARLGSRLQTSFTPVTPNISRPSSSAPAAKPKAGPSPDNPFL